jgi:hypothetical protein
MRRRLVVGVRGAGVDERELLGLRGDHHAGGVAHEAGVEDGALHLEGVDHRESVGRADVDLGDGGGGGLHREEARVDGDVALDGHRGSVAAGQHQGAVAGHEELLAEAFGQVDGAGIDGLVAGDVDPVQLPAGHDEEALAVGFHDVGLVDAGLLDVRAGHVLGSGCGGGRGGLAGIAAGGRGRGEAVGRSARGDLGAGHVVEHHGPVVVEAVRADALERLGAHLVQEVVAAADGLEGGDGLCPVDRGPVLDPVAGRAGARHEGEREGGGEERDEGAAGAAHR